MTIRRILTQAAEFDVLQQPCVAVEKFDDVLLAIVADMWNSMYAARGVGLAAPQIGERLRVAVIDTPQSENSNRRLVLVNPKITFSEGEQTDNEGCLSMPGLRWPITRSATVRVTFQDLQGVTQRLTARNLLARAVQHECDHLDGVLCNSRVATEAS